LFCNSAETSFAHQRFVLDPTHLALERTFVDYITTDQYLKFFQVYFWTVL